MQVPASLITTLMHDPKTAATASSNSGSQEVYTQHMKLQDKLLKVRIDPAISADGLTVETEYSTEVGNIEMGRYRALHSCPDPKVKINITAYYDKERLQLIKNTESKLDSLIQKADNIRKAVQKPVSNSSTISRPTAKPSQGASLLLQPLDESKLGAVRQLKFNTSNDKDDHEEDEEYDYLNGSVNSEDFEIDEIDVETIDSDSKDSVNIKATASVTTNEHSESVFNLSPINEDNSEKDLLQQCLKESGISATPDKPREVPSVVPSVKSNSENPISDISVSNWYSLPDSSTADSPDSLPSTFSDSDSNSGHTSSSKIYTPQPTYKLDFTQPQNINVALNEIQKLCSGPTVSFTPELRRDVTVNYTPDSQKVSPLSEICGNTSGNQNNLSNISWNNVSSENLSESRNGLNLSASRKRKSCDDVVIDIPEQNCVNEQVNAVESSADYQTPVLKTHRMLNCEATNILTNWYQTHVHYPYPSDEEVEQLAKLTNITTRQVKKWMANKRVRCFNTLSITGNQHPIKYKYQGTSRRKRATKSNNPQSAEKENCDSTTGNNKASYSLLNEESRAILTQWFDAHMDNPYPSEEEKQQLATVCGISVGQVKSWFANKRNRTNNTRKQVPNYFLNKFPEYTHMVNFVGQRREEARVTKRRKINEVMYIQPTFYL